MPSEQIKSPQHTKRRCLGWSSPTQASTSASALSQGPTPSSVITPAKDEAADWPPIQRQMSQEYIKTR
ncbi:hypothetical protein PVAP13_1NG183619 [Panicum virgatum]|uniref:Uncharacterized protein n=1 Tax=Panicum virgatum TaxID=38727 RepID=A0A8T0WK52_PANVG|nr:hypothetical protein PVAP13_1NG183619 [Panicum virgatum]